MVKLFLNNSLLLRDGKPFFSGEMSNDVADLLPCEPFLYTFEQKSPRKRPQGREYECMLKLTQYVHLANERELLSDEYKDKILRSLLQGFGSILIFSGSGSGSGSSV